VTSMPYRILFAASCTAACLFGFSAMSEDVAEFYKDKKVTLVVGLEAGTGFDVYTRLLARHIGRHIPGNPQVVVQNMVGASGMVSANWLYNLAPKDGTAIATFSSSIPIAPLLGNTAAKFDLARFSWLANLDESAGTCGVSPASGIATFNDLLTKPSIFGASGAEGPLVIYARGINNLLGGKIKIVAGYPGTPAIKIAMTRGEVHGVCGLSASTILSFWKEEFDSGVFKPVVQISGKPHPALKGIPHINDYVKTDEDQQVFDLVFNIQALGRFYVAPPDIPSARRDALRATFMATVRDPQFLEDAARTKIDISPMSGEEVDIFIRRISTSSPKVVERVKAALRP
jgi:tripartite-type tricarboxylate transporter receptor subunit TctC